MVRRINRDDTGSIILTVMVALVATGLILALIVSVETGLRSSRRAGDAANALQLADAGINDAVRQVASASGPILAPGPVSLGGAGTYEFTATLDPSTPVWHVDAVGTDGTGVRRRVRADAVPELLFGNALFANALLGLPSGAAVDSFISGASLADMCTRKGTVGSNNPDQMTFNNSGIGRANRNCVQDTYAISWPHPVDGCVAYGDGTQSLPPTGNGKCPPSETKKESPLFAPPAVQAPAITKNLSPPTCDPATPVSATNVHVIPGGTRYFWASVTLRPGCRVDSTNGPAVIFTDGPVDIGRLCGGGAGSCLPGSQTHVNEPTTNTAICPNYVGLDTQPSPNPARFYCPGWAGNLRIYKTSGSAGSIVFRNHTKFWGVIVAPSHPVDVDGGGNPQVEMWGAIISNQSDPNAQFYLHYDESLGGIATGRYQVRNWREEPLS